MFKPGMDSTYHGSDWLPASIWSKIDTRFCPDKSQKNGTYKHTQVDGWSIVAFWDNTIDSRPGSHSTFVVNEVIEATELLDRAREAFPKVFARYAFKVEPIEPKGGNNGG